MYHDYDISAPPPPPHHRPSLVWSHACLLTNRASLSGDKCTQKVTCNNLGKFNAISFPDDFIH